MGKPRVGIIVGAGGGGRPGLTVALTGGAVVGRLGTKLGRVLSAAVLLVLGALEVACRGVALLVSLWLLLGAGGGLGGWLALEDGLGEGGGGGGIGAVGRSQAVVVVPKVEVQAVALVVHLDGLLVFCGLQTRGNRLHVSMGEVGLALRGKGGRVAGPWDFGPGCLLEVRDQWRLAVNSQITAPPVWTACTD